MAGENTISNLSANFKEVYPSDIEVLLPDEVKLTKDVQFVERELMPGNLYHQPVITKHEHGITYSAARLDGVDLAVAIQGQIQDATIEGAQIMARARIGYEAAARSQNSKGAFRKVFDPIVENLTTSVSRRAEISAFYGRQAPGFVGSISTNAVTIAAADWAPGVWAGQEGAPVAGYDNDADTTPTATTTIASVDLDNRIINLTSGANFTANDAIYFAGNNAASSAVLAQRSNNGSVQGSGAVTAAGGGFQEMLGLSAIASGIVGASTSLTSTFGIDGSIATGSSLWRSTTFDCLNGPLSLQKINKGIAQMVAKGAPAKLNLYVNPRGWADLANDESAQRRYVNKSGGSFSVGPEGMEYYSQNGLTVIKSSPYVKEGHAFGIDPNDFRRVGSSKLTFNLPGRGDEMFLHVPDVSAYEIRCYMSWSLFCKAIGRVLYFKNIVNNP